MSKSPGGQLRAQREPTPLRPNRRVLGVFAGYVLFWIGMAISPLDRGDWLLENLLAIAFVALLIATARRFPLSDTSYVLIALFLVLHAVGAHYTYAQVPFGFWLQEQLGLGRNPFDRIVHFAYGLLLAYPMREVLVRLAGVRAVWSYSLPVSGALAQSALFELIEGVVATIVSPELGTAYLGTQGDEWDAQKDMAAALVGAALCMLITFVVSRRRAASIEAAPTTGAWPPRPDAAGGGPT